MSFVSIVKDPYIDKNLRELRKTVHRMALKKGSTRATTLDDITNTSSLTGLNASSSPSMECIINSLQSKFSSLEDSVSMDDLKACEEMVKQLPVYGWQQSILRHLMNEALSRHLKAVGAERVILTAPGKGVPNIV